MLPSNPKNPALCRSRSRKLLSPCARWMLAAMSFALAMLPALPTPAEELPENFVPLRAIGMGGASTAVSNDENAVWTNPAGIARVRKARSRKTNNLTSFPNVMVGMNGESKSFYDVMSKQDDANVENILSENEDLGDKPFWARASAFPVTMLEIGKDMPTAFGLFANNRVSSLISSAEPEIARTTVISDVGAVLGFALTDRENRFNIGFSLRPTYRYAFEDKIPSEILIDKTELPKRIKEGANLSTGLGIDVGMIYTIADFWYPTIGVALLNVPTGCRDGYLNPYSETRQTVCGTAYGGDLGNPEALSTLDPSDFRVGMSIMPRISRKLAFRVALDMHHIYLSDGTNHYGLSDIEPIKTIHAGLEVVLGNPFEHNPFSLRVGVNQGFFTVGASVSLGILELEFASYGVDVSPTSKPIEDRRYLGGLSFQL